MKAPLRVPTSTRTLLMRHLWIFASPSRSRTARAGIDTAAKRFLQISARGWMPVQLFFSPPCEAVTPPVVRHLRDRWWRLLGSEDRKHPNSSSPPYVSGRPWVADRAESNGAAANRHGRQEISTIRHAPLSI